MRRLLLLSCLVAHGLAAGAESLPTDGAHVLPLEHARAVFVQCARAAPEPEAALWVPSKQDVLALELALRAYLASRRASGLRVPPESQRYHRQYVGFSRSGTRLIYGNYFPSSLGSRSTVRLAPFLVCDGGSVFWGIVYKPATKVFEEPQFNGPA